MQHIDVSKGGERTMRSMKTVLRMAISVLVSTNCAVLSAVSPQDPLSDARRVLRNPSVTLASALRDTDRALVVESARAAPLRVGSPDERSEIAWLTAGSEAVLLVRVRSVMGTVTPGGDWITSTVTAEVEEVLKSPPSLVPVAGIAISFNQDGGTAEVAGRPVYAVVPWERPYVPGGRYLIFASGGEGSKELQVGVGYQVVQGSRLKSLDPRAGKLYQDEVEKMTLDAALAAARAAAKMP